VSRGRSIRSLRLWLQHEGGGLRSDAREGVHIWFNQGMHSKVGETELCHGPESAGHAAFPGPPISLSLKEIVKVRPACGLTPARIIASIGPTSHMYWSHVLMPVLADMRRDYITTQTQRCR
jgi:hypothetical protein